MSKIKAMITHRYYHSVMLCLFVWIGAAFVFYLDTDTIKEKLVLRKDLSMVSSAPVKQSVVHNETKQRQSDTRPIVFLHVGPHKTGTTSVQDSFDANQNLEQDNYRFLGMRNPPAERDSWVRVSLRQFRAKKSPMFINKMKRVMMDKEENLIVSAEDFASLVDAVDEFGVSFFELLATALQDRQVHVAVGYRRYYEWIVSLYNQRHRTRRMSEPFVKWYRRPITQSGTTTSPRVYQTMQRYFSSVNVINMHDSRDIMTQVYCEILPNATNTCESHMNQLEAAKAGAGSTHHNPSIPLWPIKVETEARRRGYIVGDTRTDIQERIVMFAAETNYTPPMECISRKEQDDILQTSLRHEKAMVPEFFASPMGEQELRKGFQQAVKDKAFCSIDVAQVFQDKRWLDFFNASRLSTGGE